MKALLIALISLTLLVSVVRAQVVSDETRRENTSGFFDLPSELKISNLVAEKQCPGVNQFCPDDHSNCCNAGATYWCCPTGDPCDYENFDNDHWCKNGGSPVDPHQH